jgi:hypothetical protein
MLALIQREQEWLILDKAGFRARKVVRDKEKHDTVLKKSTPRRLTILVPKKHRQNI